MPTTRAGQTFSQADLDAKTWGRSGTGQARINPQGEIEVYGESDAAVPAPTMPTPAPLPNPPAPTAPGGGGGSPMASLQAAADPGAGWASSAAPNGTRPGLGARSFTPMQKLFSGRVY